MYERYQLDMVLREQTGGAVRRSELYLQTNNKLDFAAFDGIKLRLRLDFDHTCIERQLAHRLLLHARNLLQAIARNPQQRIGTLNLIDSTERAELLTRWNETAAPRQTMGSLDEMVCRRIAQIPDSVAIAHGDVRLSYGELGRRASLLAKDLRNQGLSAGSFAAILMSRSIESAVSALAVLMTGAAYIPIDSSCPIHRLEAILDDAKPLILIAHCDLVRSLSLKGGPIIIALDGYDWTQSGGLEGRSSAGEEQAAYLIYTSGSTGRPKGVVVPHRAIMNHIQWMQQTFQLDVGDRVLQQTNFGFDVAMWEFFGTLCSGARLVIPADKEFDLARTIDTIVQEKITVLQLVPSLLRTFLNAPRFANCRSLRHVFCGGEPMPDDLPGRFYGMLPASLHNMYGPTETTIDALHFSVPRDWTVGKVPVGLPILNTQAYVLNANLEPVPVGVSGELHIGGSQVAHGYHRQSALTRERFVEDPFSALADAKLYKTGDIVRRRLDGNIEFLSRQDDQFKIRGVRGELGEVEWALLQFPYVADCAVILQGGDDRDKQLLAYVVMNEEGTVERLERFLRSILAIQHIPTIIKVSSVARSVNGKVDRAQLPLPPRAVADGGSAAAAFNSPIEESLARIWCEVLKREHIKAGDNFFDLGGDSLLAVTLAYWIEQTMGVRLGMPEIFRSPVFCEMAQLLRTRSSSIRPTVVTIREGSPAERSIYFIYAGSHEFGLARMLGVKRNAYGVEVGWPSAWRWALEHDDTSKYPTMEQLVEPFCSTILAHAGSKPFVVAGYSFAGLMAFEAARQLKARGALVDAVLLFDTVARAPSLLRVAWNEIMDLWGGKTQLEWGALTRAARTLCEARLRKAGAASPQVGRQGFAISDPDVRELSLAWPLMEKLYGSIRKQYRPHKLGCEGIVVVANSDEETRVRRSAKHDLGWNRFFDRDLQIVNAVNEHHGLPRDYNRELELKLVAALDRLN
jgi:amino acid adenylation domain-containing protein